MDKKTRDFFEKVVEEGGSPVFSGKMPKKNAEFKLATWLRTFWNFLIGNGHSKKKKTEAPKQPEQPERQTQQAQPEQQKPAEQPKQQEQQVQQSEQIKQPGLSQPPKEEEKLIETLEKAHPEEAGRTELSNATPPLEERK